MNAYTVEDISEVWNRINEKDFSKLNFKRKSKKAKVKEESSQKLKIQKGKENESSAEKKQEDKSGDIIQNPYEESKVSFKDQELKKSAAEEIKESEYPAQVANDSTDTEQYNLALKLKPNIDEYSFCQSFLLSIIYILLDYKQSALNMYILFIEIIKHTLRQGSEVNIFANFLHQFSQIEEYRLKDRFVCMINDLFSKIDHKGITSIIEFCYEELLYVEKERDKQPDIAQPAKQASPSKINAANHFFKTLKIPIPEIIPISLSELFNITIILYSKKEDSYRKYIPTQADRRYIDVYIGDKRPIVFIEKDGNKYSALFQQHSVVSKNVKKRYNASEFYLNFITTDISKLIEESLIVAEAKQNPPQVAEGRKACKCIIY